MSLASLIAEVEKLTAPSRRVDAEVAVALWPLTQPADSEARTLDGGCDRGGFYYEYGSTEDGDCDSFGLGLAPFYTSDIGVVRALFEHVFPGRPAVFGGAIPALAAFLRAIEARTG